MMCLTNHQPNTAEREHANLYQLLQRSAGQPYLNLSHRKNNSMTLARMLSYRRPVFPPTRLCFLPLPFGVISATKSSTVTCSSPFSLITSYAKAKNKSYHLKSLSVRKIFIEEGLKSCF